MTGEFVVALISSAVALLSVGISVWSARSTARLQDELEERRRQASKEELVEQVMGRYREPLLRAAFDLQSRVYNIVGQRFLYRYLQQGGQDDQAYACHNTMFVVAEYLGWVEILRRGVQFLDLGDAPQPAAGGAAGGHWDHPVDRPRFRGRRSLHLSG